MIELETPHGPARAHVNEAEAPVAVLVLGHGAGAPDRKAATEAALAVNVTTILVEQPYRVAGRKSAAPAPQLDTAWISVLEQLPVNDLPLYVGGRSSGARVACRASATRSACRPRGRTARWCGSRATTASSPTCAACAPR